MGHKHGVPVHGPHGVLQLQISAGKVLSRAHRCRLQVTISGAGARMLGASRSRAAMCADQSRAEASQDQQQQLRPKSPGALRLLRLYHCSSCLQSDRFHISPRRAAEDDQAHDAFCKLTGLPFASYDWGNGAI